MHLLYDSMPVLLNVHGKKNYGVKEVLKRGLCLREQAYMTLKQ